MIRSSAPSPRPTVRPPALKVVTPPATPQPSTPPRPVVVKPAPPMGAFARLGNWFQGLVARLRGEKPVQEPPKPAPVEPPMDAPETPDEPQEPGRGWRTLDPERDRLTVTVKPGQTLYQFARLYGQPEKLGAYVDAIREANGLAGSGLVPGQKLQMPIGGSAEWQTPMLVAVQRSVEDRRRAGARLPDLDYTRFEVAQGRFNSFTIDLGLTRGEGWHRFHVLEDMSGDEPYAFSVMLDAEAEALFSSFDR